MNGNGNGTMNGNGVVHNRIADKLPPQNLEAERKVLGAMMLWNEVIGPVLEIVKPGDFYRDSHQLICEAIVALSGEGGKVDHITVADRLELWGRFDEAGGDEIFFDLRNGVASSALAVQHAVIIRDTSISRQLIDAAALTIEEGYSRRFTGREQIDRVAARQRAVETIAEVAEAPDDPLDRLCPWPQPISAVGLHGLAGKILLKIAPESEADPAGIYLQLLAGLANMLGRGPHWYAEASRHSTGLFVCLVGQSGIGRKGTSWDHVRRILRQVDPDWAGKRIKGGLVSGEGLTHFVRDPVTKGSTIIDQGVADKRALFIETEFSRVLTVSKREGNSLSGQIRQAWDEGTFGTLTKNNTTETVDAHIGVVAHITGAELKANLSPMDCQNGFANRFLWVCSRRVRLLPHGGNIHMVDFTDEVHDLKGTMEWVDGLDPDKPFKLDRAAKLIWERWYLPRNDLNKPPDPLGPYTVRGEPYVKRLAMLFAVLDWETTIGADHMRAALEVWRYCEESARFIFMERIEDPVASTLIDALKAAGESGLSRTQITVEVFQRNRPAAQIDKLLTDLQRAGVIEHAAAEKAGPMPPKKSKGPAATRWRLKGRESVLSTNSTNSTNRSDDEDASEDRPAY